jgi:flagellar basal-body rod modification protein FlgD
MNTPAVGSPSAVTSASQSATSNLTATSDTFLKLLVTNLQHQDPTKPQDSNEYVAQISQMTMVEQLTKLSAASQTTVDQQRMASVVALLGKTVTYVGADGVPATGTVSKVDVSGETPSITVGAVTGVDPSSVSTVS